MRTSSPTLDARLLQILWPFLNPWLTSDLWSDLIKAERKPCFDVNYLLVFDIFQQFSCVQPSRRPWRPLRTLLWIQKHTGPTLHLHPHHPFIYFDTFPSSEHSFLPPQLLLLLFTVHWFFIFYFMKDCYPEQLLMITLMIDEGRCSALTVRCILSPSPAGFSCSLSEPRDGKRLK